LGSVHGILVAPGFGQRGVEGKIRAVQFARENNIPFLGICLGMQMAAIEFGRNVLGLNCNSSEMDKDTPNPVIDIMEEQKNINQLGGTMRLGSYRCEITPNSLAHRVYGKSLISERHRHRFEFNSSYKEAYESAGMKITGVNPETGLGEIIEIPSHPFFIGVQFHPEYKSTVEKPHPIFSGFIQAAVLYKAD
jgi:CTP synthase